MVWYSLNTLSTNPAVRLSCLKTKGGQSANKFRKLQIQKFAGLITFALLADLPHKWQVADIRFADPDLKTSANVENHYFSSPKYRLKVLKIKFNYKINSCKGDDFGD